METSRLKPVGNSLQLSLPALPFSFQTACSYHTVQLQMKALKSTQSLTCVFKHSQLYAQCYLLPRG